MVRFTKSRVTILTVIALLLAGCGGDDDSESETTAATDDAGTAETDDEVDDAPADDEPADETPADDAEESGDADDSGDAGGGGDAGTLVLGDETIVLDSARCFLEEQDAAAGGGKILFVGQGFGQNAAGEEIILDVSRYDEDSQFAGDDIIVDIGDFDTGSSLQVVADLGTVQLDGRTMSADGLTFTNWDDLSETPGSFVMNC